MITQILFGSEGKFGNLFNIFYSTRFYALLLKQFVVIQRVLRNSNGLVEFFNLKFMNA